jgi:ABC-type lipoprotein release transport system permease subunit
VLQSMLFQVEATDRGVLIGVSALLLFVSLCACYIPARWATRIDPMVALREP